jgi:hypothetical protein
MTKRDYLPTPEQFERDLRRALTAGYHFLSTGEYRHVYYASLSGTVKDSAKVRSVAADPTGNIAAGKEKMRTRLAELAKTIGAAEDSLLAAEAECLRILRYLTPEVGYEPTMRHPRTASRADLSDAALAQGRRMARGEGFGEG